VEIRPKRGRHLNELTRFRYDVVLHLDGPTAGEAGPDAMPMLKWGIEVDSEAACRERLVTSAPASLCVRGIPNSRLAAFVAARNIVEGTASTKTVGDVWMEVEALRVVGVDPESLLALGAELGYDVELTWSADSSDGALDVTFHLRGTSTPTARSEDTPTKMASVDWGAYTNSPLAERVSQRLIPSLRSGLEEALPEHMVPSTFVLLAELPLTPSGKVDRGALPMPRHEDEGLSERYVGPRTPVERTLAEIWCQVLGLERVGIDDNFFRLGGDSIKTIQVVSRAKLAGLALSPRLLFQNQTIAAVAIAVSAGVGEAHPRGAMRLTASQKAFVDRAASERNNSVVDAYPVSPLQEHMLREITAAPEAEHTAFAWHFMTTWNEGFKLEVYEQAWRAVVERQPALRTSFVWEGVDEALQVVHREASPWIEVFDLRELAPTERTQRIAALRRAAVRVRFDRSVPRPIRMLVMLTGEDAGCVFVSCDYLRLDGWSYRVCEVDLIVIYAALLRGQRVELQPAAEYRSFVEWHTTRSIEDEQALWRRTLSGVTWPCSIASRFCGDGDGSVVPYDVRRTLLSAETTTKLRELAQRCSVSLNAVVQAAWSTLVSKYTGRQDVVFGVLVGGRAAPVADIESMAGLLINILPLRVRVDVRVLLDDWLRTFGPLQLDLLQGEHTPIRAVREAAGIAEATPLYDNFLVFQTVAVPKAAHAAVQGLVDLGLPTPLGGQGIGQMEYPLRVDVYPNKEMALVLSFYRRFFDDESVGRIMDDFGAVLERMAASRHSRVADILEVVRGANNSSPGNSV
jgi:aryl carrier-like protein